MNGDILVEGRHESVIPSRNIHTFLVSSLEFTRWGESEIDTEDSPIPDLLSTVLVMLGVDKETVANMPEMSNLPTRFSAGTRKTFPFSCNQRPHQETRFEVEVLKVKLAGLHTLTLTLVLRFRHRRVGLEYKGSFAEFAAHAPSRL
jgi:hypothetical protein